MKVCQGMRDERTCHAPFSEGQKTASNRRRVCRTWESVRGRGEREREKVH